MAKMSRARLLETLHYAERRIAADAKHIEKQHQVIARLERRGDEITAAAARTVLATIEQAQRGQIADRDRIKGSLARSS